MKKIGCGIAITAAAFVIGCAETPSPVITGQTAHPNGTIGERKTREHITVQCGRIDCGLLLEKYPDWTDKYQDKYRDCYGRCRDQGAPLDWMKKKELKAPGPEIQP